MTFDATGTCNGVYALTQDRHRGRRRARTHQSDRTMTQETSVRTPATTRSRWLSNGTGAVYVKPNAGIDGPGGRKLLVWALKAFGGGRRLRRRHLTPVSC